MHWKLIYLQGGFYYLNMPEHFFKYFFWIMKWSYGLIRKSKKKSMLIFKYVGVKVVVLNDFENRRVLIWFYKESTKQLYRIAMHGFHARPIRKRIVDFVKGIQTDENFFNTKIMSRRSYSYKRERAYRDYMNFKNR